MTIAQAYEILKRQERVSMGAVTLEKLCYIKARLNKAPCFSKSDFGEHQREYLIYLSEIGRNKSIENF